MKRIRLQLADRQSSAGEPRLSMRHLNVARRAAILSLPFAVRVPQPSKLSIQDNW
jgi:hypothetical protein